MNPIHMWPKRLALTEYRLIGFTGTKIPCMTTLKRLVDDEVLPGDKLGGTYYVWVNQAMKPTKPVDPELLAIVKTGVPEADAMLAEYLEEAS